MLSVTSAILTGKQLTLASSKLAAGKGTHEVYHGYRVQNSTHAVVTLTLCSAGLAARTHQKTKSGLSPWACRTGAVISSDGGPLGTQPSNTQSAATVFHVCQHATTSRARAKHVFTEPLASSRKSASEQRNQTAGPARRAAMGTYTQQKLPLSIRVNPQAIASSDSKAAFQIR